MTVKSSETVTLPFFVHYLNAFFTFNEIKLKTQIYHSKIYENGIDLGFFLIFLYK